MESIELLKKIISDTKDIKLYFTIIILVVAIIFTITSIIQEKNNIIGPIVIFTIIPLIFLAIITRGINLQIYEHNKKITKIETILDNYETYINDGIIFNVGNINYENNILNNPTIKVELISTNKLSRYIKFKVESKEDLEKLLYDAVKNNYDF